MNVNDMYIEVRKNPLVNTKGLMTTYLNTSAHCETANASEASTTLPCPPRPILQE